MTDIVDTSVDTDDIEAPVEVADRPREPTPYEKKLRAEAANERRKRKEVETSRDEAIAKVIAETKAEIFKHTEQFTERLKRSELKAHAVKAGIVDLDALKLMSLADVKMDDQGEISNAAEVVDAFRKAKPHFFGVATTSSPAEVPKPKQTTGKVAKDWSDAEMKAAEDRLRMGRF